jgi:hypothetical protein
MDKAYFALMTLENQKKKMGIGVIVLHLLLCIFTSLLWLPIFFIHCLTIYSHNNKIKRRIADTCAIATLPEEEQKTALAHEERTARVRYWFFVIAGFCVFVYFVGNFSA